MRLEKCSCSWVSQPIERSGLNLGQFGPQRSDYAVIAMGIAVLACAVNSGTGNEGISSRASDFGNVVHLHAAINFQQDVSARLINAFAHRFEFFQRFGNKFLPAETGIDRHYQHQIQLVEYMVEIIQEASRD